MPVEARRVRARTRCRRPMFARASSTHVPGRSSGSGLLHPWFAIRLDSRLTRIIRANSRDSAFPSSDSDESLESGIPGSASCMAPATHQPRPWNRGQRPLRRRVRGGFSPHFPFQALGSTASGHLERSQRTQLARSVKPGYANSLNRKLTATLHAMTPDLRSAEGQDDTRREPNRHPSHIHHFPLSFRVPSPTPDNPAPNFTFGRHQRLTHATQFEAVYDSKVRKTAGPLIIFGMPNQLGHTRLGLSVGKRMGNAVARNRYKRLLREAFRLEQHTIPPGFDLIITVRPHAPLRLDAYQRLLVTAATSLQGEWRRKQRRTLGEDPSVS